MSICVGLRVNYENEQSKLQRRPAEAEPACRPFGPTDATDPIAWSTCLSPPPRPPRASTPSAAGAPRLHKSCRWRRPQSKGRSCVSGRARRDLRVRGGRGHLSERPGWPSGAPISRGSTVSMIAFGGRRGPHRSGSRCRGRPIERREAGREGCLWPDAASQGRPPDGSGGESERSTSNGRAKTLWWWWWWWWSRTNSELPQAGFPESGEVPCVLNQRLSVRPLFSGRSHEAQSASLAADRRPFSRSATGSTRSMPISPELRVHGSPPRRFCWPWLRGAGGKRRVKLGLSDSEATLRPG